LDVITEHLTTILTLVLAVGAIIALANHSIDFTQFAISLGAGSGGLGALGVARSLHQNGR
jgi:hypothetical protein